MTDENPIPVTDEAVNSLPQEYHSIVDIFAPSIKTVKLVGQDGDAIEVPVVALPVRCFVQHPGQEQSDRQQVTILTVPLDLVQELVAGLAIGFKGAAEVAGLDLGTPQVPPSAEGQRHLDPRSNGGYL